MNTLSITKHKARICLGVFLAVILVACSKDNNTVSQKETLAEEQTSANNTAARSSGAIQVSGMGFFAEAGECISDGAGSSFAIKLTGDLNGCLYVFIDDYDCSPSGTYREEGREYFVGEYNGQAGTFWTNYKFEAKYEGCDNGAPVGAEIFGRCQHPIAVGSGTGVFNGVNGRLDLKDDIEAGNFPYRGHLRF
jgi:hypothetical protein